MATPEQIPFQPVPEPIVPIEEHVPKPAIDHLAMLERLKAKAPFALVGPEAAGVANSESKDWFNAVEIALQRALEKGDIHDPEAAAEAQSAIARFSSREFQTGTTTQDDIIQVLALIEKISAEKSQTKKAAA